jgi:hypothetical protein
MVTAYLAPDRPDNARRLLDSCQECQPERGPTGARQDLTMLDSPDRPDSQGSSCLARRLARREATLTPPLCIKCIHARNSQDLEDEVRE